MNQTDAEMITGDALCGRVESIRNEVAKAFVGKDKALDQVLVALLAGGHVLIEGVPGLGKTLLVRALGQAWSWTGRGCSSPRT